MRKVFSSHLPTWKSLATNIILAFLLPILAFIVFDASGFTSYILMKYPCPEVVHWNNPNFHLPYLNKFIYTIFHGGVAHIFACASLHFIYNAMKDAKCLLTHSHNH